MEKQFDIFGDNGNSDSLIELQNGKLRFFEHFFDKKQSDNFLSAFIDKISWHQDNMKMYARQINLPRLSAWHGDNSKTYTYSGIKLVLG